MSNPTSIKYVKVSWGKNMGNFLPMVETRPLTEQTVSAARVSELKARSARLDRIISQNLLAASVFSYAGSLIRVATHSRHVSASH